MSQVAPVLGPPVINPIARFKFTDRARFHQDIQRPDGLAPTLGPLGEAEQCIFKIGIG